MRLLKLLYLTLGAPRAVLPLLSYLAGALLLEHHQGSTMPSLRTLMTCCYLCYERRLPFIESCEIKIQARRQHRPVGYPQMGKGWTEASPVNGRGRGPHFHILDSKDSSGEMLTVMSDEFAPKMRRAWRRFMVGLAVRTLGLHIRRQFPSTFHEKTPS